MMTDRDKLIELFYENNVRCDQTTEHLVDDVMSMFEEIFSHQKAQIKELQELVDTMGDYFPACINCEGKTEFGERTDKCVYLIDDTNYCTKRGIANIVAIQKENRKLKKFKSYFDSLYGAGLEVLNWHQNGNTISFDEFYDSAIDEMEDEDNN